MLHGTVRIWGFLNFFLCCCVLKVIIPHRFSIFVLFTKFFHSGCFGVARVIYLRYCTAQDGSPKPWLPTAIRQVNYNQPPQVKNPDQQHEEGKMSEIVKNNSKEPKLSSPSHGPCGVRCRRPFPCICTEKKHEGD